MREYAVKGVVVLPVYTVVEASNSEEARDIAESRSCQSVCHQCMKEDPNEEWVFDDNPTWAEIQEIEVEG